MRFELELIKFIEDKMPVTFLSIIRFCGGSIVFFYNTINILLPLHCGFVPALFPTPKFLVALRSGTEM